MRQLFRRGGAFYGELDRDAFDDEMIANNRLVTTLSVGHCPVGGQ